MNLFFSENGSEKSGTPLVLLHGFCETHEIWKQFQEELGKYFHVLCPDLPGFGKSPLPAPAGELSMESAAEALQNSLKDLNIDKCILIGHSMGGYVSLAFLEKYPDMVEGIGLFHSTAYADSEEKKRSRDNVIAFVEKHGVEKYINSFVPQLFYQKESQELQPQIEKLLSIARTTPKESIIAYSRAMQQRKGRLQVLQQYKKPVLFIVGEEDSSVRPEDSKRQAESLSDYEIHILENTGHVGMYEKPEESLKVLKNFVYYIENNK